MEIIIAAVVTLMVQWIKKIAGTSEFKTLILVVLMSLIGGAVYFTLSHLGYWDSFERILVYSGAFYTFIIRRFEK